MGKTGFTPIQELIFESFSKEKQAKDFYFTGGTALSVYHLKHRFSEDLDFFSEKDIDETEIIKFTSNLSRQLKSTVRFTRRDKARIFELENNGKLLIKIDFVHHPFPRIEKWKKVNNLAIDSLRDIATNKLLTVNQRTDIKDFVDLYYLLKKYTLWDLIYGIEAKYQMEMDMVMIASDFLKVKDFTFLPKMIKPLKITPLQSFFRNLSLEIGRKITK